MEEENEVVDQKSFDTSTWFNSLSNKEKEEEEEKEQLGFFETVLNKQRETELEKAREQEKIEEERIRAKEEEKERVRNVGTLLNPYPGVAVEAADAVEELIGDEFMEEFSKLDPTIQKLSYDFLKPGQEPSDDIKLSIPSKLIETEPGITGDFYLEYYQKQEQIKNIDRALEKIQSFMDPRYAILTTEKANLEASLEQTKEESAKEKKKAEEKFFSSGEQAWKELEKNINATVLTTMSNILSIPDAVVTAFATMDPKYGGLTDEELKYVNTLSPDQRMEYLSDRTPFASILSSVRAERNKIDKGVQDLNKTIYQFDEGLGQTYGDVFKNIKEGNLVEGWEDAIRAVSRTSSAGLSQITNFLLAVTPGGLGTIAFSSGSGEMKEVQEEAYEAKKALDQLSVNDPEYDTKKKELEKIIERGDISGKLVAHSTVVGAAEVIFERYSAKLLRGSFKDLIGAKSKPVVEKALKTWGLNLIKEAGGEGLSETGTLLLQKASEYAVLGDEEAFVDSMQEFIDNFIIGTAAGGQIKFAGSTPGLIRDLAIRSKVKKILEKRGFPSIDAAYNIETPTVEAPDALKFPVINDAQVELSQVPGVKESVDNSVDTKVKKGDLTIQQGNEIKVNFRDTQSAVNQLKPVGLNLNTEAVGLVVEKKKLENIIKEVNDRALTQGQQTRVDEINNRLGDLAAEAQVQAQSIIPGEVVDKAQDLLRKAAGVKTIVDPDLGVTLPTPRAPRADALAIQYQQDPANVDVEALLDQYNKIGLAAIKFDTRKGDMAREDAVAEINKEFAGIMERWSPEQGSFSTFVTANIAPKAQGIYDKYIGQRDVTTLDRPEAREVVAEEIDVDVTPTEVARPKVYPASLEVITENVTPEVRSEQTTMIKDDINRAVATVSTSPKAVAKNIVNQIKTKEYRQLLKDKLGRWNTEQYNNNVDRLITKDFIATLPVAQLKRRFPRLFEIEVIDRVPTVKIEDGKRTDFKKPVYRIPAITDAKLETIKDYFKANEKRHQSLMEVLGEGIAIEQMQELRGDQAFMTDLQGRLELKGSNLTAEQFLNEVEYNLDKRNLEDKSLDVVEGTVDSVVNEMITEDNVNDIEADVLSEAISKLETFRKTNLSINALTGVVEAGLRTLRAARNAGKSLLSAIKDFTKSIKDFIKKPAVKKPTPKKPTTKKSEVKKPAERFQKISKALRTSKEIIERTSSDIVKEKGQQPLPPNWSSMSGEQKINSIMWLRSVLPALGPDFVTANNLAFSSRAMFGIPNRPGSKSMSVDNIKLAIDGKFPETLTINGKTYKKGSPIPVDSQNNFDPNGIFNAGKVKYNKKVLPKLSTVVNSKTGAPKYKKKTAEQLNKLSKTKAWFEANNPNGTKINYLYDFTKIIENDLQNNPKNLPYWELFLRTSTNNMGHIVRSTAPIVYWSKEDGPGSAFREEHNPPQNNITQLILDMAYKGDVNNRFDLIRYSYAQGKLKKSDNDKIDNAGLAEKSYDTYYNSPWSSNLPFIRLINPDINAENGGINTDNYNMNPKGDQIITMSENFGFPSAKNNSDKNKFRNELLYKTWIGEIKLNKALREYQAANKVDNLSFKQVNNNKEKVFGLIKENSTTEQSIVDMGNADQAAQIARDINAPTKGISVFDFDDTLAYSNSKVIVNMPDGTVRKITPAEFAVESENLLEQGAEFDFSEFNKVVEGRKGPLADLALKRQEKFGSGDIFVLTARPQASAISIKAFLDGIGLNIPLKNITGLEDGSPDAKALWILDKAAKGYNDFYFADDALPNVQAVKNILDQVDVKSDIQQAKANKVKDLDKEFNVIIEQQSGKQWYKTYSKARAKTTGRKVGRFEFFIPPSAEDFSGLLYKILPKGEKGNLAKKWFKDNLFDPFNKAEQELISAKITVAKDFQALRENIDNIPRNLNKPVSVGDFTHSQALRVYIWNMQGMEIPGLSTRDLNRLVEKIENNADLKVFAEKIAFIQKGKPYPAPGENWIAGNITSDIIQSLNKTGRKQFLQEWQQNVDIIFSDKNLNKLEALYGSNYVIALKNVLGRMKSGSNRPVGANPQVNALLDWLNNSVGAVMFLNMRSAGLQLISSVNFMNWSDNNPFAAAKAFANQKQYWSDVMTLLNSDYLVQRRNGLKINVAESEIAEAARKGGMRGAIAYLLNKGFVLTRFADSMAIATGGATFYRNRVNKLLEQVNIDTGKVYTKQEAEAVAFDDFYQISEESQQSSRTDRISMQQASSIGRLILNFANTPMQYARIMKKSAMDLKNGRGDWKTNVSKIVYYGMVQNLIFNAMQQAIFALAYGSDDEEERTLEDRAGNIADGMVSSLLRGLGYGGAAVDTVKDVIASLVEQGAKKNPKYEDAVSEVFNFSPAIDSKVRKLRSALKSFSWNMGEMKRRGFNIDNPAYLAISQIVSATTNVPLDRAARITMNIRQALDRQTEVWQKVALMFGYSGWELGLPYWGLQTTIDKEEAEDEAIKVKYKKYATELKSKGYKRIPMTKGKPAGKLNVDFIKVTRPTGDTEYWLTPKK